MDVFWPILYAAGYVLCGVNFGNMLLCSEYGKTLRSLPFIVLLCILWPLALLNLPSDFK